jgi:hypothetical protein
LIDTILQHVDEPLVGSPFFLKKMHLGQRFIALGDGLLQLDIQGA